MAIDTHATQEPFGHRHETLRSAAERPINESRGGGGRSLLTVLTGALVGVTIGLAALAAYAVIDENGDGSSGAPQQPASPAPADPNDVPADVSNVSLFAELEGVANADPRAVVQAILTNGGYADGWTSTALYDSEALIVVALTHQDNPPGNEFLNLYRLVLGDDGLWHAFPGYDAINSIYGTAEDAMFAYATRNHPGAAINVDAAELPEGATSVSWTVVSDSPDSRTYEVTATGAEPVTVVINKINEIDAETGTEIQGWRGTPPELFPY